MTQLIKSFYSDPLCVPAAELRALIQPLIDMRNKVYNEQADIFRKEGNDPRFITGIGWLEQETGLDQTRLSRILYKQKWVTLSVADHILTSVGLMSAVSGKELTKVANPQWSLAHWINYFIQCGDPVPDDVIIVNGSKTAKSIREIQ